MSKVTVYRFKKYDITSDSEIVSSFYATKEAIERFQGILIEENSIEIEKSMLDGDGKYKPKEE